MDELLRIAAGAWPPEVGWPDYARDAHLVAIHEAGHLCVDLALRVTPEGVDLLAVSEGDSGAVYRVVDGEPVIPPPGQRPACYVYDPDMRSLVLQRAAMYAGGYAAELLHVGAMIHGWPRAMLDTEDGAAALTFLGIGWNERIDGPLYAAWLLATDTLREQWPWLLRVAAVIETTGRCSKADALALRESRPTNGSDGECRSRAAQ
jgi:hypothetical protein